MTWCSYFVILQRCVNVYGALDTQYGEDVRSWSHFDLYIQNILSMPSVAGFPTAIIVQGLELNNQESNELFTDGDMLWTNGLKIGHMLRVERKTATSHAFQHGRAGLVSSEAETYHISQMVEENHF